jgi:hypothetical protein
MPNMAFNGKIDIESGMFSVSENQPFKKEGFLTMCG